MHHDDADDAADDDDTIKTYQYLNWHYFIEKKEKKQIRDMHAFSKLDFTAKL
jgi:hypothetical protein